MVSVITSGCRNIFILSAGWEYSQPALFRISYFNDFWIKLKISHKLAIRSANKKQNRGRKMFSILLGLFVLFNPIQNKVWAQNQTDLAVSPFASEIILNNNSPISLVITDGVNVNAFDVEVTYDPSVVTVLSFSPGPYLSNLLKYYESNQPGRLRVGYTQAARPGVSGSGVLLIINFKGTGNGLSPISITFAGLYSPTGYETLPTLQHGTLLVHADPTTTPSHTVTGSFALQGQPNAAGIPIEFGYGQNTWLGPYSGTTSALSPNFSLPNVAEDTYPVTISLPRYLNVHADLSKKFTASSSSTVIPPLLLRGGNAVWQDCVDNVCTPNNIIDAADVSLVGAQYLQSGSDLDGDVNYSDRVDIFDLAMVGANYGLTSKDVFSTWLP